MGQSPGGHITALIVDDNDTRLHCVCVHSVIAPATESL